MTQAHYPTLRILSVDRLFPHEVHDETRTPPLVTRIEQSKVLRNPPLVSPFPDGSDRCMVLDGANRVAAFKRMECPHILAQVVEPTSAAIGLSTWNHVVWEMSSADLIDNLNQIPSLTIRPANEPGSGNPDTLVSLHTPDGQFLNVEAQEPDFFKRAELLHTIMDCYKSRARFDRTPLTEIAELAAAYQDLTAMVVYPQFRIEDLFKVCDAGQLFPSGITRFSVTPRALRVNYPLDELAADKTEIEKDATLQEFIQHRIAGKGVRFYTEPTVLFDE